MALSLHFTRLAKWHVAFPARFADPHPPTGKAGSGRRADLPSQGYRKASRTPPRGVPTYN
ncbi:MAG TPA: hypothetical protein VMB80_01370 [Candidatus Acidoferrum sp.]|nr:hypothetical protein [Candidatus Acidoferrum sp.]